MIFERGEHQLPLGAATLASPLGTTALVLLNPFRTEAGNPNSCGSSRDGEDHSPFTKALIENIDQPFNLAKLFSKVHDGRDQSHA